MKINLVLSSMYSGTNPTLVPITVPNIRELKTSSVSLAPFHFNSAFDEILDAEYLANHI